MHPGNEINALKRRATLARKSDGKTCVTCPASRHVQMMAEYLTKDGHYQMLADEPEHCAGSMLAVVAALWEARLELAKLKAGAKGIE
jgi:hypothetical protein